MANNAFVTVSGGRFSSGKIDLFLTQLVQTKWGDRIAVSRDSDTWWRIEQQGVMSLTVEMRNPRRISLRPGTWPLTQWALCYVQESLATYLNGVCSDEGFDGTWKGVPERLDTFQKWFALATRQTSNRHPEEIPEFLDDDAEFQKTLDRIVGRLSSVWKIPKALLG